MFLRKIVKNLVITKYGPIIGNSYVLQDGVKVYEFLGIRFAAPPTGKLRFEKPQAPNSWRKPMKVQAFGPSCVPCQGGFAEFSEDCLYLNIWTPSIAISNYPVVVYIHGGAYLAGSGEQDSERIREVYARNGIVFVSIQYRLAFLGFLTLNSTELPPNLGLWDQNWALQWVQQNIHNFGGDRKRVTIWGQSAGGSSVGQHTVSHKSQGLFAQVFEMSGSPLADFARGQDVAENSREIIARLGCSTRENVKDCLRLKSLNDFFAAVGTCLPNDFNFALFSPMVDGDFFEEQPEEGMKRLAAVPTLIGLNQIEGRSFTLSKGFPFSLSPKMFNKMTNETLIEWIKKWVTSKGYGKKADQATEDIFKFYAHNHSNSSSNFWVEQYAKLYSDYCFNVPQIREAVLKSNAKAKVWAFLFDHYNPARWPTDWPCQGSAHSTEAPYCLRKPFFEMTNDDKKVSKMMQNFILEFVKTGMPVIPSITWETFSDESLAYLSFKPTPTMEKGYFLDSYTFWTKTMTKYDYDFITRRNWSR
ncbi:unnamed protein product, partial [Mesorhabditis belari]|uniref:Carboxylic ester hydrolase n=1 Tax=Mesorhabditis belari TaxID=2138241 RepID=A0AAF3J9I7_9BILA